MRDLNYALRGACYEIQKTLEAFFGRCEVLLREDMPTDSIEVEVQYKTPSAAKWYRHSIRKEALEYGRDIERYLAREIPHRIVLTELDAARNAAASAMNHFK